MKKVCVNCFNTKPWPFLLLLSSMRVKKVVCNTCYDHYDNQKSVVIVEVDWGSWRGWGPSVIVYILSPPPTHSYTHCGHSNRSTCPTSPSSNCEMQKLSRRRRRRAWSLFDHATTSWLTCTANYGDWVYPQSGTGPVKKLHTPASPSPSVFLTANLFWAFMLHNHMHICDLSGIHPTVVTCMSHCLVLYTYVCAKMFDIQTSTTTLVLSPGSPFQILSLSFGEKQSCETKSGRRAWVQG